MYGGNIGILVDTRGCCNVKVGRTDNIKIYEQDYPADCNHKRCSSSKDERNSKQHPHVP